MIMKTKKILSVLMVFTLLFSLFTGCNKKEEDVAVDFGDVELVDFSKYKDSDDIPDWQGEKIKLTVWSGANGPNSQYMGKISSDDVVSPEISRITGVEFDAEKVQKWIANGAQPTDTVKRLLKEKGII